ncbi:MAG: GNAT family N-acetyltransferase [Pseudomonadota bacterium]
MSAELFAALEATWPPAAWHDAPGWRVPEGRGGGNRVSAARPVTEVPDIDAMARIQDQIGQERLVQVRRGHEVLDAALEAAGYTSRDATLGLVAPVDAVAAEPPRVTAFEVDWPMAEIGREIWAGGGIGPARVAVMDRVQGPKCAFLGRVDDQPAAAAFVACHGPIAMVHALEVLPQHRRKGVARHLMQAMALWALREGASRIGCFVTENNVAARTLYAGLGLGVETAYHYRVQTEPASGGL